MSVPSFAVTRKVNPEGVPALTAEQLWEGLKIKARNPVGFIPGAVGCEIVDEKGNTYTRKVTLGDGAFAGMKGSLIEEITVYDNCIIYFNVPGTNRSITNIISYDENAELILTFSFAGGVPGVTGDLPPPEELNKSVGRAVDMSLNRIRELVKEGKI